MADSTARQLFTGIVGTVVGGVIVWWLTAIYHASPTAIPAQSPSVNSRASDALSPASGGPNRAATSPNPSRRSTTPSVGYATPNSAADEQEPREQPIPVDKSQPEPAPKSYRITAITPSNGDPDDYTFVLKECHRSGDLIRCWGLITNTTDAPRSTDLHDSMAVDDEGNSIFIGTFGGGFMFPGANSPYGTQQKLLPGVPTKFVVTIGDPHRNVKSINLNLKVNGGQPYRYDSLILKDVPVQ